ncbi:hypothetical protein IWQ61_010208 [Dispira simplex]|nr:hypothetical protein IWQ61_010208 [Dispira simplex]
MKINVLAIAPLVLTALLATASAGPIATDTEAQPNLAPPPFRVVCVDEDGTVSADVSAKALGFSQGMVKILIKAAGKAGDGKLGTKEFDNLMGPSEIQRLFQALFKVLDENDDGQVSREEFVGKLNPTKDGITEKELKDLFDKIDSDQDGFISGKEFFLACIKK